VILPGEPHLKAVHNERAKTTASYLYAAAGTCLVPAWSHCRSRVLRRHRIDRTRVDRTRATLTLASGITIFLLVSLELHAAARFVLRSLRR
jgi:type VI protein secretion system component VasF